MLKLIGLSLTSQPRARWALAWPGTVRAAAGATLAFIDAVLRIRHELQYRLTPLPDVVPGSAGEPGSGSRGLFLRAGGSLSAADTCTVGYACRQALLADGGTLHPGRVRTALMSLFDTLGQIRPGRESAGAGSGARASA